MRSIKYLTLIFSVFAMLYTLPSPAVAQNPTSCEDGKMLSLPWNGRDHLVMPGCYTQAEADAWCQENYAPNTAASADGDYLFCLCADGAEYNAETQACGDTAALTPPASENCPDGQFFSEPWEGKEHIIESGCYTQESADAWCETNYKSNTVASPDGNQWFCGCKDGAEYNPQTQACDITGAPEDTDVTPVDDAAEPESCECPKQGGV